MTCCSTGIGWYCRCFSISTVRAPRSSCRFVAASRSDANDGERFELAVLREVEAQTAGDLLHRLDLRRATDARHRDADVDRRAHAGEEQVGLEEDLAVGDRDDVRRDVRRDVAGLRLDDRQRGERAAGLEDRLAVHDDCVVRAASPRARAGASGDRTRRPGTPRGPADGAARARAGGTRRPASTGRRTRRASACPRCT